MTVQTLLLEDDPTSASLLSEAMARHGFLVTHCSTVKSALDALARNPFELALVDRLLDQEDGLDFVRMARALVPALGIIILSGKGQLEDRIAGLESGADDYLPKPFDLREILLRARNLGSRATIMMRMHSGRLLTFLDFTLDPLARTLRHRISGPVHLTGREFDVLHCLARSGPQPQSRNELKRLVHDRDLHTTERTIDTLISHIRHKLRAASGTDPVRTIRNRGYAFGAAVTHHPHPGEIAYRA